MLSVMDETQRRLGNQDAVIARMRKVRRLIAILDSGLGDDWDLALRAARSFTDDEWLGLGVMDARIRNPRVDPGRVQAPSQLTRQAVIDGLEERLKIRRVVRGKPAMERL